MANITLHSDRQTSATSVSNIFIDEYMTDANGEFVKIYLYLLRQLNAPDAAFSISAIADKFEHTEKDIRRALSYWERMHLLRLEYDSGENLTGVCFLDTTSRKESSDGTTQSSSMVASGAENSGISAGNTSGATNMTGSSNAADSGHPASYVHTTDPANITGSVNAASGNPAQSSQAAGTAKNYTAEEIASFRRQEPVAELLFIAERYLGRILTPTDMNSILYWYDGLGFSADLIEYLIEYCVSKGHTSIRYIEKVALAWAENHITSVDEAKQSAGIHSQLYFAVMKALGITGRSLVPTETAYIDKWRSEYGFSSDIITVACERTIQSIHQPKFEYIDSILTSWKKHNVSTIDDIAKLDEAHQLKKKPAAPVQNTQTQNRNRFNNFEQRSYDYDELERMLLTTNAQPVPHA